MANRLRFFEGLPADSLILVAVSGGGDSVFMALELAEVSGVRTHLAHVNHGRRGEEDRGDALLVERLADQLGVGFSALSLPDRVDGSHSLEERFRKGRLTALVTEAHRLGAKAIAFGQTVDDVAETFLLMALRGSGPTGLGSLRRERWIESKELWMLRPVLDWSREEIRTELRKRGVEWRDDPTNEQPLHRRNRLRSGVVPLLVEEEPAAVSLLARSARLCAEASDLLEDLAADDMREALVAESEGIVILRNAVLAPLTGARLAILLRVATRRAAGESFPLPPTKSFVEALAARILSGLGDTAHFDDDEIIRARVDNRYTLLHSAEINSGQALEFLMEQTSPALLLPSPLSVVAVTNSSQRASPMGSRVLLPGGQGSMEVSVVERSLVPEDWIIKSNPDPRIAYFDPLSLRRDLVLRTALADDTLPMGESGSKSVGESLQEAGVPAELRDRVAVLADDRGVLWIPGVRRAVSAYVTDRSTLVLRIEWKNSSTPEIGS